jgi:hypothetical protein
MEQTATHPPQAVRGPAPILETLRQAVFVGLRRVVRRSLAETIDDLLEKLIAAVTWQERQAIDEALDLLRNGRDGVEANFERAFAERWTQVTTVRNDSPPAGGLRPSVGLADLALVDDSAIGERLAVGRIAARSRRRMDEEQVDGLRARFGELLGRDWFADDDHPIAPDLVFEALCKALAAFGQVRTVRFLLEALEPRVSTELAVLHAEINQRLVALGVLQEIRYRVAKPAGSQGAAQPLQSAGGETPAAAPGDAPGVAPGVAPAVAPGTMPATSATSATGSAAAMAPDDFVGRVQAAVNHAEAGNVVPMPAEQVVDLVGQLGQRVPAAQGAATRYLSDPARFATPAADAAPPSDRLMAALTGLQASQPAAGQDVATQASTARAVSSAVAREHGSPLERLIIETVSLVFEHVYEDEAISDAIKQQLLRLQVAAFKAALIDPSFFARPEHPMRRLIDRIAEIGSDPDFENAAGTPLVTDVAALVTGILADFDRDLAVFAQALERLDVIVQAESERRAARLAKIAAAAQKAEVLERARERVRAELQALLDDDCPEFVCRFVGDAWAEVLSRIVTGAEFSPFDASRARRVVQSLRWSVAPKAPAEIATLAAELPQLIADLSRGLSFIALSSAERELFFSELLAWHGATIEDAKRAGRTAAANAAGPQERAPPGSAGAPRMPAPGAQLPATAAVAVQAGPTANDVPSASRPEAAPADDDGQPLAEEPVATDDAVEHLGLTNGSEVELTGPRGERKRFKVGWMSPRRSVFIFSRYPRDHWTVRRPVLNSLLEQGSVRLVSRLPETRVAIERLSAR